jgi:hypothetical protein
MNCVNGICYFSKEVNIESIARVTRGSNIEQIKNSGKEVKVQVFSSVFNSLTLDDIQRQLQVDNPQIEIVYNLETIDEDIQKATKPIWSFSIEDNFLNLKRV